MLMTEISNLNLLAVQASPMASELQQKEVERQLSLFQIFRKLYEDHSSLLNEILQIEAPEQSALTGVKPCYVQGVVEASDVYVITNLCENKTQSLQQPQGIWTIGRDTNSGIHIADRYLSERHAAIQYIDDQGFYLIDFNSSNGSFVNGEPVYQPKKLKDGDRIRLGSITFDFFINQTNRVLPTVAIELLLQLVSRNDGNAVKMPNQPSNKQKQPTQSSNELPRIDTDLRLFDHHQQPHGGLSAEDKSEILDRFFSRSR
ncbi:MAG: FHA domain-containing protein [Gloeotrichia echinulata DEX184]|jgi:pSer/pThr/pTyr-binding forkhead associated (FHA) protein